MQQSFTRCLIPLSIITPDRITNCIMATDTSARVIYIIEDDLASATMMREALQLEGDAAWAVQVFTNSSKALEAITEEPPNLILLDLIMPGLDGGALFQK